MRVVEEQFVAFREHFDRLEREISKVFVGQREIVEQVLTCLFCQGHVLLEGMPGLGKTLLVKALSGALDLQFSRIQCTPDLMPADIIGTNMLLEDSRGQQSIRFQKGPIFANIVLTDEINRATPKTQSAFLEAMQERKVTVLGETHVLEEPFLLLATQNPIEMEGTYPLPEAQLDRFFFKLKIKFPKLEELSRIMDLTTGEDTPAVLPTCSRETVREMNSLVKKVKIAERVKHHAIRIVMATHPEPDGALEMVRSYVKYGASPRAAQSMVLGGKVRALSDGRYNVAFDDLREVAVPSLIHRIIMNFEGEVAGISPENIIEELLAKIKP